MLHGTRIQGGREVLYLNILKGKKYKPAPGKKKKIRSETGMTQKNLLWDQLIYI